jgi:hypothetical protein
MAGISNMSFGDLFLEAIENQHLDLNKLNKNYTYMFELVSPYTKVVVPYEEIAIWHIGTRDNDTLEELDTDIGIQKPQRYSLTNLSECIAAAAAFERLQEGFVVVDKNYNRIKVKSPFYVELHHTANNGNLSKVDTLSLIFNREEEEYLTYFPEKKDIIENYKNKIMYLVDTFTAEYQKYKSTLAQMSRKDAAIFIRDMVICPDYFFTCLFKEEISAWDYLKKMPAKTLLERLEEIKL